MRSYWKRILFILNDKNKKNFWTIISEVIRLFWLKREFPLYYFGRFFYKKGMPFPKDYMNLREYNSIIYSEKLMRQSTTDLLNNKISFALFGEQKSLPMPKTIGYNILKSFSSGKLFILINSFAEFKNYSKKLFQSVDTEQIFIKANESKGGKGVYIISKNTADDELENIWNKVKQGSYIFQEALQQHESVNKIYPNSINTVRIETYLNNSGDIEILGGFMRFGTGTSYVDNISSGGFFVPCDINTGKLHEYGFTALIYGSNFITHHPNSGFPISNYEIPFFFESVELCKEFARHIPHRIVGWDVAITPSGPVIIEGNHDAAIIKGEHSYEGFKKHPAFKEILAFI